MEKKNNGVVIGLLIGIILVLVVVFGLYATGIISFTTKSNNSNGNTNQSIKIDESKYYVYDAEYQANTDYLHYGKAYNNEFDTQKTHDGFDTTIVNNGILYLKDLVVPYININTSSVKAINEKLEKLYNEYVNMYNESASNYDNIVKKYGADFDINNVTFDSINDRWSYPMLKYYTYQSNNILSVVVTYGVLGTDILHPEYLVYNFDLSNGNLLNYDQFLSKFDLNVTEASSLILKQVSDYVKSSETYISEPLSDTEKNLNKSITDGTVLFFVDNQGNVNYIVDIYMNAGSGNYPQKITIAK